MLIILSFFSNTLFAKSEFFQEGINLFKIKKYEDAKFKFEQDIVLHPKNEKSYLYLSKIFNMQDKKIRRAKFKNCNAFKSKKRGSDLSSCKIKT